MPTSLKDRLAARIVAELAELDRIKTDAVKNAADTQQRLTVLRQAQAALTPELETLITGLANIGVKILE
jgi:hypothetical protein